MTAPTLPVVPPGWCVPPAQAVHDCPRPLAGRSPDPPTGLVDRPTFLARLRRELSVCGRGGGGVSVLCLRVEDLGAVDAVHGRGAGGGALVALTGRLHAALRLSDTLARTGGDRFAVICPGHTRPEQGVAVMDRLRTLAVEPVHLPGRVVRMTVRVGVAFSRDADLDDGGASLLARAAAGTADLGTADLVGDPGVSP